MVFTWCGLESMPSIKRDVSLALSFPLLPHAAGTYIEDNTNRNNVHRWLIES